MSVLLNSSSVLVKPDVAAAQIAADTIPVESSNTSSAITYSGTQAAQRAVSEQPGTIQETTIAMTGTLYPPAETVLSMPSVPVEPKLHRFYGSVKIHPLKMASDAGKMMEEVVQHLTALYGANVQVTLEIQANVPNGIPADVVNTLKENCRQLRFDSFGLEEE